MIEAHLSLLYSPKLENPERRPSVDNTAKLSWIFSGREKENCKIRTKWSLKQICSVYAIKGRNMQSKFEIKYHGSVKDIQDILGY